MDYLAELMPKLEKLLFSTLSGSVHEQQVNAMCLNVVKAGGKRIRPRLAILSGLLQPSYNKEADEGLLLNCAASTELLHTATLIHDDVIDKSSVRRGVRTLNDTSGNHLAVLAGDYLFARCFRLLKATDSHALYHACSETPEELIAGEINQLNKEGDLNITLDEYYRTIFSKTGALFVLATTAFALVKKQDDKVLDALREYGKQLGIAFQIVDDVLDYSSTDETLGKKIGTDLNDKRITLPLILALKDADAEDRKQLSSAIDSADINAVTEILTKYRSLEKSLELAKEAACLAKKSLGIFSDSVYKQELCKIADMAADRRS